MTFHKKKSKRVNFHFQKTAEGTIMQQFDVLIAASKTKVFEKCDKKKTSLH